MNKNIIGYQAENKIKIYSVWPDKFLTSALYLTVQLRNS